jgi:hypothetical protein
MQILCRHRPPEAVAVRILRGKRSRPKRHCAGSGDGTNRHAKRVARTSTKRANVAIGTAKHLSIRNHVHPKIP